MRKKYNMKKTSCKNEEAPRALYRSTLRVRLQTTKDQVTTFLVVPRILETQLHPQRERAENLDPILVEEPAAAAQTRLAEVDVEANAARVERVRPSPETTERDALTGQLVVREHQSRQEGRRAEAREVVLRQLVADTNVRHERPLLVDRLQGTVRDESRHPEHDRVRRRLVVLQGPTLQVLEAIVAGAGLRRVRLQREATTDAPGYRTAVPKALGELVPAGERLRELLRNVRVRKRNDVLDVDRFRLYARPGGDDKLGDVPPQLTVLENETDIIVRPVKHDHLVHDPFQDLERGTERAEQITLGTTHGDLSSAGNGLPLIPTPCPDIRLASVAGNVPAFFLP